MPYRNQLALLLVALVALIARLISQLAWYISFPYQPQHNARPLRSRLLFSFK